MVRKLVVIVLILFAVATTGAVYWNSVHNDFVNMDDPDLIVWNRYIKELTVENIRAIFTPGVVGAFQPVRTLSYALDYHFWKLNPFGYHLTNITCHALSVWLLFLLVRALGQPDFLAGVTALLFAVHPVHVEAVTWLSGRRDVLLALFVLLSLFGYVMFRTRDAAASRMNGFLWYGVSLAACCLGLLSKATAVIIPALLILYDGTFGVPSGSRWRKRLLHIVRSTGCYLPFVAATAGFMAVFVSTSQSSGVLKTAYHGVRGVTTFLTMVRVFGEYLHQLLVPANLSLSYGIRIVRSPWNPSFLIAAVTLIGAAILAALAWKRAPIVSFGIAWWGIALLPVSNILPIAIVQADRYLYVPSIGFFLALAWACNWGWNMVCNAEGGIGKGLAQVIYLGLIAALLGSYGWLTVLRNQDWRNSETLWNATLETHPDSSIALNNLGLIYAEWGEYERAINLYQHLLQRHPRQDAIERVYTNLGDAYAGNEQFDAAFDAYQQSLQADPEYVEAYLGLARLNTGLRDYAGAARIYELALEFEPNNERVAEELGKLRFIEGQFDAATALFQQVLNSNPYAMAAYNGLGLCYSNSGQYDNAYLTYQQALAIEPESTLIRNSLGTLYMAQGESEKAIRQFQELLRIEPENVEVRNNLGTLYLRTEQYADALRELMETVKRQPDDPRMISNLAQAYAGVGLPEQAIKMAQWALELNPTLFKTQLFLGDICAGLDDFTCAAEAYEHALKLQPNSEHVQERLQMVREARMN